MFRLWKYLFGGLWLMFGISCQQVPVGIEKGGKEEVKTPNLGVTKSSVATGNVCPYCHQTDSLLKIRYIDPIPMTMVKDAAGGKYVLGGCDPDPGYSHTHFCKRDQRGVRLLSK